MANVRAPWAPRRPPLTRNSPPLPPCSETGAGGRAFPRFIPGQDRLAAVEFSPGAVGGKVPARDLGIEVRRGTGVWSCS